jgi:two-component system LytT family response regulator
MLTKMRSEHSSLRILIVDSDPASREALASILSKDPENSVIEQCGNGLEAMAAIRDFAPDVLFCEVETTGIHGFTLLETIPAKNRPVTIFMSNRNDFAARAFEVSAVDYLVKPVRKERFMEALERARYQLARNKSDQIHNGSDGTMRPLAIKTGRCLLFVKVNEIDWAEAQGKFVRIHMGRESLLLKVSISALEEELNPGQFVRIHRSTIINIDRVRWIQPFTNKKTYQVILQDGTKLVLSRKSTLGEITGTPISSLSEIPTRS